jgi:pimeloyl-ACP methyl ester carboxylesterase
VLHHQWIHRDDADNNQVVFVFLHGLFGQGINLKRLAQQLCQRYSSSGLLIDLPGHGKSSAAGVAPSDAPVTVADCATAVRATVRHCLKESETPRLFGHSLGGRVAVHYALQSLRPGTPSQLRPDHIWLLDTVPEVPDPTTRHVLAQVQKILLHRDPRTRAEVRAQLSASEPPLAAARIEWLTMQWIETERRFLFDALVVEQLLHDISAVEAPGSSLWQLMGTVVAGSVPLHLVQAGSNPAWPRKSPERIRALQETAAPESWTHQVLPNAGHWVHVDNLPGLMDLIAAVHGTDEVVLSNEKNTT